MGYELSGKQSNKGRYGKSKLDPLSIIILNALMPLIGSIFPSAKAAYFSIGFLTVILLLAGLYKKLAIVSVIITGFMGIYIWITYYTQLPILASMLRMLLLFFPCFILAWILIKEYRSSEIMAALEKLRLPKIISVALLVTIRYISTFSKEFRIIKSSMQIRGVNFSLLHPLRTFEYLLVPQLFRCETLSSELTIASLTKGLTSPGRKTSFYERKLGWRDICVFAGFAAGEILIKGGII